MLEEFKREYLIKYYQEPENMKLVIYKNIKYKQSLLVNSQVLDANSEE